MKLCHGLAVTAVLVCCLALVPAHAIFAGEARSDFARTISKPAPKKQEGSGGVKEKHPPSSDGTTSEPSGDRRDDRNEGSDEDPFAADREAIKAETERILEALDSVERRHRDFQTSNAAFELALAYSGTEDPVNAAMAIGRLCDGSVDPFLRTGEERYAAADLAMSQRQRALRRRFAERHGPSVGDPVRISDGAFTTVVPLPVISYWGLEIDLSLHYDSSRQEYRSLAPGWWWGVDESVVPGRTAPIDLQDHLHRYRDELTMRRNALEAVKGRTFPGTAREIDDALGEASSRLGDRWAALVREADSLAKRAAALRGHRGMTPALEREVTTVLTRSSQLAATLADRLPGLHASAAAVRALAAAGTSVDRAEGALAAATEEYREYRRVVREDLERFRTAAPSGMSAHSLLVGNHAAVYYAGDGGPHQFDDGENRSSFPYFRMEDEASGGWRIHDPYGQTRLFDSQGRLTALVDGQGHRLNIDRLPDSGDIVIRTDTDVELARLETTAHGWRVLVPTLAPTEITVTHGLLTRVSNARGVISYSYREGVLTAIERGDGSRTQIMWSGDAPRRVQVVDGENGGRDEFSYPSAEERTYRDADGVLSSFRFRDGLLVQCREAGGLLRTITYDDLGRPIRETSSAGTDVRSTYNPAGALLRRENGAGLFVSAVYDDHGRLRRLSSDRGVLGRWSYNQDNQVVLVDTADGHRWTVVYRPDEAVFRRDGHEVWTVGYDAFGRPADRRRYDGRHEQWQYDRLGRNLALWVNGTEVERWRYDSAGRLVGETGPRGAVAYTYDDRGFLQNVSRDGSAVADYRWSATGDLIGVGNHEGTRHQFDRSPAGRVLRSTAGSFSRSYHYDDQGRLESVTGGPEPEEWRFVWDSAGRLLRYRGPATGTVDLVYSGTGTHRGYLFPSGAVAQYSIRPGGALHAVDYFGREFQIQVDAADRPREVRDQHGRRVSFQYSPAGRRVLIDGTEIRREETDRLGRLTAVYYPDGTEERWSYHDRGRRIDFSDRRGGRYTLHRNDLGLPISATSGDGRRWRWVETDEGRFPVRMGSSPRHFSPPSFSRPTLRDPEQPVLRVPAGAAEEATVLEFDPSGLRGLSTPQGYRAALEWYGPGLPEVLNERFPDGQEAHSRTEYLGSAVTSFSGLQGEITVSRRNGGRSVVVQDRAGRERRVSLDPYGTPLRETVPSTPPQDISRRVDPYGRHESVALSGGPEVTVRYPSPGVAHIDPGVPALATTLRSSEDSVSLTIGDVTTRISATELRVAERLQLRHRSVGETGEIGSLILLEESVASGRSVILEALAVVRGDQGEILVEESLFGDRSAGERSETGTLQTVSDDGFGRRRNLSRQAIEGLERCWSSVGLQHPGASPSISLAPLVYSAGAVQRDSLGRITATQPGTSIEYAPIAGVPAGIADTATGADWEIWRDLMGSPVMVRDRSTGRSWRCAEVTVDTQIGPLTLRVWDHSSDAEPSPQDLGRYSPGADRPVAGADDEEGGPQERCLVVLHHGRPLLIATGQSVLVPVLDIRWTLQGLATYHPGGDRVSYRPFRHPIPEIAPESLRDPGNPDLPTTLPWDRWVYGMVHLPGTAVLLSRHRAYLPERGVFSSRDPALSDVDWYRYAGGDPLNNFDPAGLRFVPADIENSHVQQDPRWAEEKLGSGTGPDLAAAGCVVTALSNMINTVAGRELSNPGNLDRALEQRFFRAETLLAPADSAEVLTAVTGRPTEVVSFDPATVNMQLLAKELQLDETQEYLAAARIRTYHYTADGTIDWYRHSVNVTGFDPRGRPLVLDTSRRSRDVLDHLETVERYDIYAYADCRSY